MDVRRRKEARKAKLRESAAKMKQSGKIEPSFQDSKYSLPEDATTPNMRGREYSDRYQLPGRMNCRDWVQVLVCGTLCALWKATVAASLALVILELCNPCEKRQATCMHCRIFFSYQYPCSLSPL